MRPGDLGHGIARRRDADVGRRRRRPARQRDVDAAAQRRQAPLVEGVHRDDVNAGLETVQIDGADVRCRPPPVVGGAPETGDPDLEAAFVVRVVPPAHAHRAPVQRLGPHLARGVRGPRGHQRVAEPGGDRRGLAERPFVVALAGDADPVARRRDARTREVRLDVGGVGHRGAVVAALRRVDVAEGVGPHGLAGRTGVGRPVVRAEVVAHLVGKDLRFASVDPGVAVGVRREAGRRVSAHQQAGVAAGQEQPDRLAREQMDHVRLVPDAQRADLAVRGQPREQVPAEGGDAVAADAVEDVRRLRDVDGPGLEVDPAVAQDHVQVVDRVPDGRLGAAQRGPNPGRLGGVEDQDVQAAVARRAADSLRPRGRGLRRANEADRLVARGSDRAEVSFVAVCRSLAEHRPVAARIGADPELGARRLVEASRQAPALDRQHDAVVRRASEAARPLRVAAAAVLEDGQFRLQRAAVGGRQDEPPGRGAHQVEVDFDRPGRGGECVEGVAGRDGCRGGLRRRRAACCRSRGRSLVAAANGEQFLCVARGGCERREADRDQEADGTPRRSPWAASRPRWGARLRGFGGHMASVTERDVRDAGPVFIMRMVLMTALSCLKGDAAAATEPPCRSVRRGFRPRCGRS